MTEAIAHRGPDGEGYYFDEYVGIGHRRLAIIDVAKGQQPMFNEDGSVVLTFNGQIYNYRALKEQLIRAGHKFKTNSDTEVVVHAWEEWGPSSVSHFRGMFAFGVYDKNRGTLFLARDRLGKKPLHYAILKTGELIFASELKSLLVHPLVRREIDPVAVDRYLAFGYVPEPNTIYRGIFKLPAAHWLVIGRHDPIPKISRYWRLRTESTVLDEDEAVHSLLRYLDEAVRIRLMSEVPLGAFLSGGVDSSAIVSSMARQVSTPVKTFALGFDGDPENETAHARRVAERYGTEHTEANMSLDPLSGYLRQAEIFDEPFADSSSFPTLEVCSLARQQVTVALSGDAGDEVFAGYRRYRWLARTERLRRMFPGASRKPVFGALASMYPKLDWAPQWLRAKTTLSEIAVSTAEGYFRSLCKIRDEQRLALYTSKMRNEIVGQHPAELIAHSMEESGSDDPITCAQYADLMTYLPGDILTKVDRCSMAVSLEVRAPLLDHKLVEWATALPASLKLGKTEGKYILKRALEPFVPLENLYRPKRGFATSLAERFRGSGAGRIRAILKENLPDTGLFNWEGIDRVVRQHESRLFDHSQPLWSLLMFSGFLSKVHDASSPELEDYHVMPT